MFCKSISTSFHALQRMIRRKISPADVRKVIEEGEIIKQYPDDSPDPSVLIFLWIKEQPIHVVLGKGIEDGNCTIITVYIPEPEIWNSDFRTKKN